VSLSGLSVCRTIAVAATLPAGEFGVAYSQMLTAGGGMSAGYVLGVSGALPGGVLLDSAGALTGTPRSSGFSASPAQARPPPDAPARRRLSFRSSTRHPAVG